MQLRSKLKKVESIKETELLMPSKKIKKKRSKYQKIDDSIRLALFEAVKKRGEKLKTAASRLKINYSTAKSIFFTYRKKGRICKNKDKNCKVAKSTTDSPEEINVKEEAMSETQTNQQLCYHTNMSTQTHLSVVEINSPHQPQLCPQPNNSLIYLGCFTKSASILERIKLLSEKALLESQIRNESINFPVKTPLNTPAGDIVTSLKDLIGDLHLLEISQISQNQRENMFIYRYNPIPLFVSHSSPSVLRFQPLIDLRPEPI